MQASAPPQFFTSSEQTLSEESTSRKKSNLTVPLVEDDNLFPTEQERRFFNFMQGKRTRDRCSNIDFGLVKSQCSALATRIKDSSIELQEAMRGFATRPTIVDEISRSLYLLSHIDENSTYFMGGIHKIAAFMPRNQLLYSSIYMGFVPGLMSQSISLRPPKVGMSYTKILDSILRYDEILPGFKFVYNNYTDFAQAEVPSSDAILFTGSSATANQVRTIAGNDTLFLQSGSGHNPIIVNDDADLDAAAKSIVRVCFHNQGQDCGAPSAILAHSSVQADLNALLVKLTEELMSDFCPTDCFEHIIGANTDPIHLSAVTKEFTALRNYIIYGGQVDTVNQIIYPTIIDKPLNVGPSYDELFAPVIVIHGFDNDSQLLRYFHTPEYLSNAMFLTYFGSPPRILENLEKKRIHPSSTILANKDLHQYEKGTIPYGGYGKNGSVVMYENERVATPILPQRELYRFLVLPSITAEESTLTKHAQYVDSRHSHLTKLKQSFDFKYAASFCSTHTTDELQKQYACLGRDESTQSVVSIAGRITSIRNSGMFLDVEDTSGKLQVFNHESCTETNYLSLLTNLDVGDIVGVHGVIRRTKRGELTINSNRLEVLSKCLQPISEIDTRTTSVSYKDSLNILTIPNARKYFLLRNKIVAVIRKFLTIQGFLEIALDNSPYILEQVVASQLHQQIFKLDSNNSSERSDVLGHNQTVKLQICCSYTDYSSMLTLLEALISNLMTNIYGSKVLQKENTRLDFSLPYIQISMIDILKTMARTDGSNNNNEITRQEVTSWDFQIHDRSKGQLLVDLFDKEVAPNLIQPCHITHLPTDVSPYVRHLMSNPFFAERVKTYCLGYQIADTYSVLIDPGELERRLQYRHLEGFQNYNGEPGHEKVILEIMEHGLAPISKLELSIHCIADILSDV